MNVIDARKLAIEGTTVIHDTPYIAMTNVNGDLLYFLNWLQTLCPSDAVLSDAWYIAKEKKVETYMLGNLKGLSIYPGLPHIPNSAKVTIEWEE